MPLIDNHIHLHDERIFSRYEIIVTEAMNNGVRYFINNGTHENDWSRVEQISTKYREVVPCFGLHPWHVCNKTPAWLANLSDFLKKNNAAVGEIGLDYSANNANNGDQENLFRTQVALAIDMQLPFIVHCYKAWDRLFAILNKLKPFPAGFMLHSFNGSAEIAQRVLSLGGFLSASTILLRPNRARLCDLFMSFPVDRILVESDSPDQSPHSGQLNSPVYIYALVELLAKKMKISTTALEDRLWQNSVFFWGKTLQSRMVTSNNA